MGGHGGLNILPQKKWNVYNYDNRDIVQKDKKQHAQKMRKKYQQDRKGTLSNKFHVLKGQNLSTYQIKKQKIKEDIQKDNILNNQFRRLAEENKHVNLFQNQQKIIQNREVLQMKKLKQAEWLKNKDSIDYSSKFLGTYNDQSKIPWYAKSNNKESINKIKPQRYDLDDLIQTHLFNQSKSKHFYKKKIEESQRCGIINDEVKPIVNDYKIKEEFTQQKIQQRQRSRNRKYQFMKNRQNDQKINQKISNDQLKSINKMYYKVKIQQNQQKQDIQQEQILFKMRNLDNQQKQKNNTELDQLRAKRLKRQDKQRKKTQQLKKRMQTIK